MRVAAQHRLEEGRAGGENDAVRLQPGLEIKKTHLKSTLKMFFFCFFLNFLSL